MRTIEVLCAPCPECEFVASAITESRALHYLAGHMQAVHHQDWVVIEPDEDAHA